ncbi:MAG: hypothetical protein J5819_10070 [Eubacterium sp.]|nr:hypothetical protein [Eubacterium sp.]
MYRNKTKTRLFVMLLLLSVCLTGLLVSGEADSAASISGTGTSQMNIYAMYLNTDVKGESVLLESGGEYLLMDLGTADSVPAIIDHLKRCGATKIRVYISHIHADHYGGYSSNSDGNGRAITGLKMLADAGFTITTLYLPDDSIAPESTRFQTKESLFEEYVSETLGGETVRLKTGSKFTFGDANVEILGPITSMHTPRTAYAGTENEENFYENDQSLAAMITCGKTKYFTAGDCWEHEAESLIATYGEGLRADIMKLNHHGTTTGNSDELLAAVRPRYAFASNCGLTGINPETGKWYTTPSVKKANKYGVVYLAGTEKRTLVYHVENGDVKMYYESVADENLLRGELWLYGAEGTVREKDCYLLDENGHPLTGIRKYKGHDLYLGDSGCMQYGVYDEKGKYSHWKFYGDDLRYFRLDKNETYADCMVGIKKLTDYDNSIRYFGDDGILRKAKGEREFLKVGGKTYCMRSSGTFVCGSRVNYKGADYYFGGDGAMAKNKIVKLNSWYYYFGKNGKMVKAKGSTPKIVKIGRFYYAFRSSGTMVRGAGFTVNGHRYYFDNNGRMRR